MVGGGGQRERKWAEGAEVGGASGSGLRGRWWVEGAEVGRGEGGGQREAVAGRGSNGIEGAKRLFGCERSKPSCSGSGSAERSAAEHDPTSS